MKLSEILKNIEVLEIHGDINVEITRITADSREVELNSLFVATKGLKNDAHNFIPDTIKKGVKAIIYSDDCPQNEGVCRIKVTDTKIALALAAANFYDNPSKKIKIIGVTGTNGKTTIATSLYNLFTKLGYKCGLLSTVRNIINETVFKTMFTTPRAVELNQLFAKMVAENCEFCFMEVSSHAIEQHRTYNVDFDGAIFTNITHDHLDFHQTFKNYLDAKKRLFDNLKPEAFALTNIDDKNGSVMIQNSKKNYSYSLSTIADFKAKVIETHFDSTLVSFNNKELWLQFVGKYNVYNLLAVYAVANLLLPDRNQQITEAISTLKPVVGRFDVIKENGIFAVVDYAHTPDALENILKEMFDIRIDNQRIISVVGAGGDRDKTKRPKMAAVASFYSDILILTSDNPRSENPEDILNDMQKGIETKHDFLRITDRRQAIKTAVKMAKAGDIILIAGKGHETYQEINGIRHHFDDKEEVSKFLNELKNKY